VLNVELVDTCTRYDVAPLDAFQLKVGEVDWFGAPVAGDASEGVPGAAGKPNVVVKLHTVE
jgi:hypothetical protein